MFELIFIVATISAALLTVVQQIRTTSILVKIWGVSWLLCALVSVLVWWVFKVNEILGEYSANIVAASLFLPSYFLVYSRLGKIGGRVAIGDLNSIVKTAVKEAMDSIMQELAEEGGEGLGEEEIREISGRFADEIKASIRAEVSNSIQLLYGELSKVATRLVMLMGDKLLTDEQAEELARKIFEKIGPGIKGMESQAEGISFQDAVAAFIELMGFRVESFKGKEKPDHFLYAKNELIAIGSSKAYTITTSWTFHCQRIGEVELRAAKEGGLPLVLNVLNKATGRIWTKIIEPAEVGKVEEFSLTAPRWLWKPELTDKDARDMAESRRVAGERLREMLVQVETRRRTRKAWKSYR